MTPLLVRGGRLPGGQPLDVRIAAGRIVETGEGLDPSRARVVDARDGFLIPGLWDAHVHFGQWSRSTTWFPIPADAGPGAVCAAVRETLARRSDERPFIGFGHRSANWGRDGSVEELDAFSGRRPVFLISGDAHNGWLNSAALRLMGLAPRSGPLREADWFPVLGRLGSLPGAAATRAEERAAASTLASRGLVGIVDLESTDAFDDWPARVADGIDQLRVRAGVYEHQLDDVIGRGLRSGRPLAAELVSMGPLKVISDGSLSTHTAWCEAPYRGSVSAGAPNLPPDQLRDRRPCRGRRTRRLRGDRGPRLHRTRPAASPRRCAALRSARRHREHAARPSAR